MDGYVTTGVAWIPRHLATIIGPFLLDVGRMPAASRVSIQFYMVSYCSAIKFMFLRMEILFLFIPNFSQRQFSHETVNWLMADYNFKAISLIGVPSLHVRQPGLQSRKWKNNGHVRRRIFINYPVKIYKKEIFLKFNIFIHRFEAYSAQILNSCCVFMVFW